MTQNQDDNLPVLMKILFFPIRIGYGWYMGLRLWFLKRKCKRLARLLDEKYGKE